MIRRTVYFFGKAGESMRRAPVLTLATIATLSIVFLLFIGFALIAFNMQAGVERFVGSVKLCVFLSADTNEAQAMALANQIKDTPEVLLVRYVSPEVARARFLADFPGNRSVLDGLPDNPLPASLEVELSPEAQTLDTLSALAQKFRALKGVEDAIFGRELFTKLTAALATAKLAGGVLGLALALAVLFLTANTIRLNLYARRDEIAILQLVGATNSFLRLPFLIEGFLQGLLGAALSIVGLFVLFVIFEGRIAEFLSGPFGQLELRFLSVGEIGLFVALGAFLGALGSFITLTRNWSDL